MLLFILLMDIRFVNSPAVPESPLAGIEWAKIPLFLVAFSTHRLSSANTGRYRGSDGLLNLQMRRWAASIGISNSFSAPNRADMSSII